MTGTPFGLIAGAGVTHVDRQTSLEYKDVMHEGERAIQQDIGSPLGIYGPLTFTNLLVWPPILQIVGSAALDQICHP